MTSKYFTSIGFSVCALIFLILIIIMYIGKKRQNKNTNNDFLSLLIFTLFLLIVEIIYITCMSNMDKISPAITMLCCRLYLIGAIVWIMGFLYYLLRLGTEYYEEEKKKKIHKKYLIVVISISVITSITSCFFGIEYNKAINDIYSFTGPASYFIYVVGFIAGAIMIALVMLKRFDFPKTQKIPVRFALIIIIGSLFIQAVTGYDLNNLTYLFAFMIATLFFTTESQDNKMLEEIKESKEKAETANKAKTQFLENISHEIRTPLSTILGFSETLLSQDDENEESIKDDVENIHEASVSLVDLVNNILDISSIESSKEELSERDYELHDMIVEINNAFSPKANKYQVTFEVNADRELPKGYHGDYEKLYKSIMNILINALKYTHHGKISLEFLKAKNEQGEFSLEIIISNTGHEMKEEYFNFNFNDFVKIGESVDGNIVDSVTLGISVAKQYITMMGGRIEFKNEPGKGTRYFIYLEPKVVNEERIGDIFVRQIQDNIENKKPELSNKNVLILDDTMNIKILSRLLNRYELIIDSATTVDECINKVKENKYDLIFLNYIMPNMNGMEALKQMKEVNTELAPVIALTTNDSNDEKYLEEGFNGYLVKPINPNELNKLINNYFSDNKGAI